MLTYVRLDDKASENNGMEIARFNSFGHIYRFGDWIDMEVGEPGEAIDVARFRVVSTSFVLFPILPNETPESDCTHFGQQDLIVTPVD